MLSLLTLLISLLAAQCMLYCLPTCLHPRKRHWQHTLLQHLLCTTCFLGLHVLTQRPLLSAALTLMLLCVLVIINNAKYRALREPLLLSDAHLYIQVFRHPRLFLPFLNIPLAIGAVLAGALSLYTLIAFEGILLTHAEQQGLSVMPLYGQLAALFLSVTFSYYLARQSTLSFKPIADVRRCGLFNSLLIYAVQASGKHRKQIFTQAIEQQSPFKHPHPNPSPSRPDLIIIQNESFFDARRLYPALQTKLYQHFDHIRQHSLQQGTLHVPAWGANTLRTEYSFLAGLPLEALQHFQFHPYAYLKTPETLFTLPHYLNQLGYQCICIHPNDSRFFGRDQLFPQMGFESFLDIAHFQDAERSGAYISDLALARFIENLLEKRSQDGETRPLFLFVITMENHGPLHWESYDQSILAQLYQQGHPTFTQHHDLTVYLKHIRNADQMLDRLSGYLQTRSQVSLLTWYGDHVPSMPNVYHALDFQDGRTDYLIWHNQKHGNTLHHQSQGSTHTQPLDVSQLAITLLRHAGLP